MVEIGDVVDYMWRGNRYTVVGSTYYDGYCYYVGINEHGIEKDMNASSIEKVQDEN